MLNEAFAAAGTAAWGGLPFSELAADMTEAAVEKATALCPNPHTVFSSAGAAGGLAERHWPAGEEWAGDFTPLRQLCVPGYHTH